MSFENRLRLLFWPIRRNEFDQELAERDMKLPDQTGVNPQLSTEISDEQSPVHSLSDTTPLDPLWEQIVSSIADYLDVMTSFVTVSVSGMTREQCEPYVQAGRVHDGSLLLEAVSNNNLELPLSISAHNTLHNLGWQLPTDSSENHFILLPPNRPSNEAIAEFLMRTLLDVYGVSRDNEFEFFSE